MLERGQRNTMGYRQRHPRQFHHSHDLYGCHSLLRSSFRCCREYRHWVRYSLIRLLQYHLTCLRLPLYEIWHQATRSPTIATVFVVFLAVILLFTIIAAQQGSSRLTWAFARDDALIFSKYLRILDPKLSVPVWALLFNSAWMFVIGCVYLASSTAFNAIVSPGLILEQVTFAIPAALLMWQGRPSQHSPAKGPFKLGKLGWVANAVTVGWACFEIIFYNLPAEKPVTSGNMSKSSDSVLLLHSLARKEG